MEVKDFVVNMKDAFNKERDFTKREIRAINNAENYVNYNCVDDDDRNIFENCEETVGAIKEIINKLESDTALTAKEKEYIKAMEYQASLCN